MEPTESPSTWAVIKSFPRALWCANIIELFERWAYYGVRALLSIYIVDAAAKGGLEFNHLQKGSIYSWWALIQCLLPMFTGGYADRYGYKKTMAVSWVLVIAGYLLMGTQKTYWGFFFGCMMLATGTAVFKPGVQGTIAHSLDEKHAAVGWGLFYQMVNIGGFIGPWVAGYLRMMSWKYVFMMSAVMISVNYLMLFLYSDPKPKQAKEFTDADPVKEFFKILYASVVNIFEPKLISFLLLFSGFWLMFMQLFDILPNFIDDWVDSSGVVLGLGRFLHIGRLAELGASGFNIPPEWMVNLNAGFIIVLMIPIAVLFSRLKALTSIIVGIFISACGLVLAGSSMNGALCILGILIFSIGEMASSPKKMEYLSSLAPPEKKGLYLGYANVPLAIGWAIGSKIGGYLYENFADKTNLARRVLETDFGMTGEAVKALPKQEVLPLVAAKLNVTAGEATRVLFERFHPDRIWIWFALIGLASMIGLIVYDRIFVRGKPAEAQPSL
ncbi:MAG TPA: transporter [Elusimicrobia bacterium]|nr:transporter [Elusimicrobiota bacterium]